MSELKTEIEKYLENYFVNGRSDLSAENTLRKIECYREIYPGDKELFGMLAAIPRLQARVNELEDIISRAEEPVFRISQWCDAYPVDIFPEPDHKKAHKILKQNGMTLDAITASAMRHVLKGITKYAKSAEKILSTPTKGDSE